MPAPSTTVKTPSPWSIVASPAALQFRRLLSSETRAAIDKAIESAPVVLFMKGTPETPQCGFSRASIQVLGLQGVDPKKFTAFNVLEDPELRQGIYFPFPFFFFLSPSSILETKFAIQISAGHGQFNSYLLTSSINYRNQRILRMANDTAALCRQGICGWMRYSGVHAPEW